MWFDISTSAICGLLAVFRAGCVYPLPPAPPSVPVVAAPQPPEIKKPSIVSINSAAPGMSLDIYEPNDDGDYIPPPANLPQTNFYNEAGLLSVKIDGETKSHPAIISLQAAEMPFTNLDVDAALLKEPSITPRMKIGLDWLTNNTVDLESNAITWHYNFDYTFNQYRIRSGWTSSFAQAAAIRALELSYRRSKDSKYRDLAIRAAYAYTVPCERGGLRCVVGGIPWFEEIPAPYGYAPMILNGHMYSVYALNLLSTLGDKRINDALAEGIRSTRMMLLRYDTGYWSQYQMRPRLSAITLKIAPAQKVELREVSITSQWSQLSFIKFDDTYTSNPKTNGIAGPIGERIGSGRELSEHLTLAFRPGRLAVGNDPVNFEGFDITVRYAAESCPAIAISTTDWRGSTGNNNVELPAISITKDGSSCVTHAKLPNSLNQWATLSKFYHDWHTALVGHLWTISGDPFFFATAVRWKNYSEGYDRNGDASSIGKPVFQPTENLDDDDAVVQAFGGTLPSNQTIDFTREMINRWSVSHIPNDKNRQQLILQRAGIPSEMP